MKKKIKIAGAGLSGLTAGINLLRSGYEVIINEKKADIGSRFSNDFQGIVNWMTDKDVIEVLKEMNIEINFLAAPFKEGIFFGPGFKNKAEFKSSEPLFYLVKRGSANDCIDFSLMQQFQKDGGIIEFNNQPDLKDVDIIATGPKKAHLLTLGYNFETDFRDIVCEVIDKNLAPKAYAYLIIKNGQGTLASASAENFQSREIYLEKTVQAFKKNLGLTMKNQKKFGGFADFFLSKTAIRNGKIYVGEAAGFQDCFTGLGMYFALRSGYLAAKSISEKTDYDELWKREFNKFLKVSIINRLLFEIAGYKGSGLIMKSIQKNQENLLDLIKTGYNFDWKMKAIYPFAHLFMGRRISFNK